MVRAGSRAHGLAGPDSDEDSRGVCVPPKRFLYGLSEFEQWQSEGGDHVIFALQKFARLALDGNPNIIETLFTREEDHLFVHPLAERLRDERELFLSKRVGSKFGRYALHQLQKIERHYRWLTSTAPHQPTPEEFGAVASENSPKFPDTASERAYQAAMKHYRGYQEWRKNRNPKRSKLEEQFGYDTKHAMHLCRLLLMGCEILQEGAVRVHRPDAEWLKSIREGLLSYEELLEWAHRQEETLKTAEGISPLPDSPDFDRVERLVVEITERFLSETG